MIQKSEERLTLAVKLRNQELGFIPLLISGFKVFKANLIPIAMITIAVNLPVILISKMLTSIFKEQIGFLSIYLQVITLICQIPAFAAVITIVEQYVLNGKSNAVSALRMAFSKWSLLFRRRKRKRNWEALIALAFFLASDYFVELFPLNLLLLVPAYIFMVRIFFNLEARYLRDLDMDAAYLYSNSLVQGRWKKVFLMVIALAINNYFLAFLSVFSISSLAEVVPAIKPYTGIIFDIIGTFISDLWFIVATLLFLNLEYRKS